VPRKVAVIGGGVVGCAVAHALARRGVPAVILEAEHELAAGASGSNSGILHTGFDSKPGELETRLILRAAALREELGDELGFPILRCGAELRPRDDAERGAVRALAQNAHGNGVPVRLLDDGGLEIPGESITDPVAYTYALADAASAGGGHVCTGARVLGLAAGEQAPVTVSLATGEKVEASAAVNCAGLFADDVAAMAGERPFAIYPRKGEFLVFAQTDPPLAKVLLPVPSPMGKGVLVFPTLDGRLVAGPTARERTDKRDWSVEEDAVELIRARAEIVHPPLRGRRPLAAYAGLRPASSDANYVIAWSRSLPRLLHVGAIRSTGLSASLAIGELVVEMLAEANAISPGAQRPLPTPRPREGEAPWWRRAADHSADAAEV
jgi:glycerol-3-phosphate dehydrogenase